MRIAFSAIAVYKGAAGIGRYAANAAHSLAEHAPEAELLLLVRDDSPWSSADLPAHVSLVICRPTGPMWEQLQVPGILERYRVDLYHSPLFMVPTVRACRQLPTIHDVIPDRFPEATPREFLDMYRRFAGPSLRASDAVLTVSEYSRRDLAETLALDGKPVHVAYQAISDSFGLAAGQASVAEVRGKHGLARPYILYVGSLEPRKNPLRLVDAFARLSQMRGDVELVFAGRTLFPESDPERHAGRLGLRDRVRSLGYVDDGDLPGLYAGAQLLAFPSAYEGFGLPVTEAMACGCPVVCADNSSLPEAGGDAAVYIDPDDADAFAGAMALLLDDHAERDRRIEVGLRHAARFTREAFARDLMAVYREVLAA
jgi:glycosyltransferase involved in cell wall biosynthesis